MSEKWEREWTHKDALRGQSLTESYEGCLDGIRRIRTALGLENYVRPDSPATVVNETIRHIESQRAELEAAREVVKRAMRSLREPRGYTSETDIALYEAIKHYDALRSQQTTTGCYDPWGLERSEDATTGERSK